MTAAIGHPTLRLIRVRIGKFWLGDPKLVITTGSIIMGMTGNPHFPSPTPNLSVLQAARDDFSYALTNAADGGKSLTCIKNAKRAALVLLLRQLAAYLQVACNNDLAALLSSCFPHQKPNRQPVGVLSAPSITRLAPGILSGTLDAVIKPVPGASTYNWRVMLADTPGVVLQTVQTTAASCTISGLTPGLLYQVRVNAIGSAGPGKWSGPRPQRTL